ncbi:MAG: OmpH family outer membrane protein, partial [Marinirhabdus sp.]
LEKDYSEKLKTYDATIKNYQVEENVLTLAQSKTMQDSIVAMKENIDRYRNNANQLLAIKRDEFLQPLYSKIGGELEKIAAAQGYTQIFQRTNDLIYIDNRFDVTLAVLKALGIEVEEN